MLSRFRSPRSATHSSATKRKYQYAASTQPEDLLVHLDLLVCALRHHVDGRWAVGTSSGARERGAVAHLHQRCSADPSEELPELSPPRPRGAVRVGQLRAGAEAGLRYSRGCGRPDHAALEAGRGLRTEAEARSFAEPPGRRRARRLGRGRRSSRPGEGQSHSRRVLRRVDAGKTGPGYRDGRGLSSPRDRT